MDKNIFNKYLDYYRDEYEDFMGVSTLNTNSQIYTLEEQVMRYAKHLSFWYMKIDQLKQTQPDDMKIKNKFLKMETQRTIRTIENIFPEEIVSQIINMAKTTRKIHQGILTNEIFTPPEIQQFIINNLTKPRTN